VKEDLTILAWQIQRKLPTAVHGPLCFLLYGSKDSHRDLFDTKEFRVKYVFGPCKYVSGKNLRD